jgi:TfoX/Sxy family transcriptional regulator of competence genes
MAMPKPSEETKALFRAALPPDPRVQAKPMFGQLAGFVNGNMFTGIFGDTVWVRVTEADRAELLQQDEAYVFEPMAGRPMKDYIVLPQGWTEDPARLREWISKAFTATAALPPKEPKPAARKPRRP